MIRVDVFLADPAGVLDPAAFGAGALIRIESAPAPSGPWTEQTTLAVVADALTYRWWDPAGDSSTSYRYRLSDAGGTIDSDYSAVFAGTSLATTLEASYATLDDVLRLGDTTPSLKRQQLFASLLPEATRQVVEACGHRDYLRHPSSGTDTWLMDGDGTDVIHVHEGIVELDLLELSFDGGRTYVTVTDTDYVLRGDNPFRAEPIPDGEPAFHIRFTGFGQYVTVPPTVRAARGTGIRGWPAVPSSLVLATAQRVRQLAASGGEYSGSAPGFDGTGSPSTGDRFWPQSLYNFLQDEHDRFLGCSIGTRGVQQVTWAP